MMTKYLAATLAFVAALVGIVEKAFTRSGIKFHEISTLQWFAIVVASVSYGVVLFETRRTQAELAIQKRQRAVLRGIVEKRVRRAIEEFLFPFRLFLEKVRAIEDLDRADTDPRYVLQLLGEPQVRSRFQSIEITGDLGSFPPHTNSEALVTAARELRELLAKVVESFAFAAYFRPETLAAVEGLRSDRMISDRLSDLETLISAQDRVKNLSLDFVLTERGDYGPFDTMLARVRAVLDQLDKDGDWAVTLGSA